MVSILHFKTIAQYIKLQNIILLILNSILYRQLGLNLNKGHHLDPANEFSSKMNTLYISFRNPIFHQEAGSFEDGHGWR